MLKKLFFLLTLSPVLAMAQGDWKPLFNGKDLKDWTPKIRTHELGENFANTFRVADGLMQVRYDGYEQFGQQYGHLFTKNPSPITFFG